MILAISALPLVLPEQIGPHPRGGGDDFLCVMTHYLAYYAVFEYQYTTLLPLLPALVWLYQRETSLGPRRLLMASFAVCCWCSCRRSISLA